MANVLYGLGLLPSDKLTETSGLDLTADFVGQTKTKVTEALKEAKGGILFIDEAYNLGFGSYGKEACDTIVAAMTSEEFKDVVIVIAGYPSDINKMLDSNAGLKSRFTQFFHFPDWEVMDCLQFFTSKAEKENFELGEGVAPCLEKGFMKLVQYEGWGNGRDVVKLWRASKDQRSSRAVASSSGKDQRSSRVVASSSGLEKTINCDDVSVALKNMLDTRRLKHFKPMASRGSNLELPTCPKTDDGRLNPQNTSVSKNEMKEPEEEEKEEQGTICLSSFDEPRDDGVSDEIWAELQDIKTYTKMSQVQLKEEREEYQKYLDELEEKEAMARLAYEVEVERIKKLAEEARRLDALMKAEQAEEKRKHEAELERKRREKEEQKRLAKIQRQQAIQERLRQISPCPAGFDWYRHGQGW
eukprot:CAMPEP_0183330392 /NCGR_PEP_ID=MMETSP0160_2-20130417/85281_1 /TAXON_ID=2839 ORGANISM="Odontella Sinensis, Strain Grunow 1884" /NCGR_SAMPLE_ID=MMETSP0160_2 /ASSEMBLY_ACC=CAM_ASM_000250 /LENGTH=413 /DNA_ID=CAMNT_0025498599 /DNA_START=1 /DNA_END=1239 /DNA_ORIENTATION=-